MLLLLRREILLLESVALSILSAPIVQRTASINCIHARLVGTRRLRIYPFRIISLPIHPHSLICYRTHPPSTIPSPIARLLPPSPQKESHTPRKTLTMNIQNHHSTQPPRVIEKTLPKQNGSNSSPPKTKPQHSTAHACFPSVHMPYCKSLIPSPFLHSPLHLIHSPPLHQSHQTQNQNHHQSHHQSQNLHYTSQAKSKVLAPTQYSDYSRTSYKSNYLFLISAVESRVSRRIGASLRGRWFCEFRGGCQRFSLWSPGGWRPFTTFLVLGALGSFMALCQG